MKLKEILKYKGSNVITIGPDATLYDALHKIIENKVGALLVKAGPNRHTGIITERDIMREVYKNTSLNDTCVTDVMTREMIIGAPDDDFEYAMSEMTEGRFRHMPIVENDTLVGIISIGDIVKAQLRHTKHQVNQLIDYVATPLTE